MQTSPNPTKATTSVLLVVFFFVALSFVASCAKDKGPFEPPRVAPFALGKAGATSTIEFRIVERHAYVVSLQYEYNEGDQADRREVWKLAGGSFKLPSGNWLEPGAPLQIRVVVTRENSGDMAPLIEDLIQNPRLSSWGSTLNAKLAEVILDPGMYVVTATSIDEAPLFVGARTNLSVTRAYRGK